MTDVRIIDDVLVEYKDWYKCFKEELLKQPGTEDCESVYEAAQVVAEHNPYIKYKMDFIERSEGVGPFVPVDLAEATKDSLPIMARFLHLDLMTKTYIALYLSLTDENFASIAGGAPGKWHIGPRELDSLCEAFLCLRQRKNALGKK